MKRVTFKAKKMPKKVSIIPYMSVYANQNRSGWGDWAFEIGWLCWAVGFMVKEY